MYQQQPYVQPQVQKFSEETTAIIKEALAGKLEALWAAESAITAAILADANLSPEAKATEISRSMTRYQTTQISYRNVEIPINQQMFDNRYPSVFDRPMGGMSIPGQMNFNLDPMHSTQFTAPLPKHYSFTIPYEDGTKEHLGVFTFNYSTPGVVLNISTHVDGLLYPAITPVAVFDEDVAVGLAFVMSKGVYNADVAQALFNAFLEDTNNQGLADSLTFGKRGDDENDILYIGMVDYGDEVEKENFSDIVTGFTTQRLEYDQLFPASAE